MMTTTSMNCLARANPSKGHVSSRQGSSSPHIDLFFVVGLFAGFSSLHCLSVWLSTSFVNMQLSVFLPKVLLMLAPQWIFSFPCLSLSRYVYIYIYIYISISLFLSFHRSVKHARSVLLQESNVAALKKQLRSSRTINSGES